MTPSFVNRLLPLAVSSLFFCCSAVVLDAAPVNDNFAARLTLNDSVTATASNVDGTLEASEPIPTGFTSATYQSTIWWQWTPSTINPTQWYEIHTVGSEVSAGVPLDTVVSVWTGNSYTVAPVLAIVHVNDQAVNDDGTRSTSVSRIRFLATNGANYKIAVASRTAARGTVKLTALPIPAPFSQMTEPNFSNGFAPPISFSPTSPNVATAVPLTVDVRLAGSTIGSGLFTLYTPSNAVLATTPFSNANLISGFPANGVYRVTLNLPQNSPTGACRWGLIVTFTDGTKSSAFGWEGLLPLSLSTASSVTLINDSYAAWLTSNGMTGTTSTRGADYDGDGLKNLVEFAFGCDPKSGISQNLVLSGNSIASVGLPVIATTGTGDQTRLRVQFVRRLNDSSVSYTVQFSDDLVNWSNATNSPNVIGSNASFEVVSVDDDVFVPAKTLRFGRVQVTQ